MADIPRTFGKYPSTRLRRIRQYEWSRHLIAEHTLNPSDLIWPVFVREGADEIEPIPSMPGVDRISCNVLAKRAKEAFELGIRAIAIFPQTPPHLKDTNGSEALNPNNLVCQAVRSIKDAVPDIGVICDVALDPYTSHGQDGLIIDNYVENDETIEVLCQQALNQARAGCDIIAPSDMMDGRVGAIRQALDSASYSKTLLLSYAAKYASAFYSPFRDAVGSSDSLGKADKRTYQMDSANISEAIREVALDVEEGADMLMIKPGMPYLDVVKAVKEAFALPTFVYQVSGEYAMIMAASQNNWLNADAAIIESLLCFKRAGADGIFTYSAMEAARIINN